LIWSTYSQWKWIQYRYFYELQLTVSRKDFEKLENLRKKISSVTFHDYQDDSEYISRDNGLVKKVEESSEDDGDNKCHGFEENNCTGCGDKESDRSVNEEEMKSHPQEKLKKHWCYNFW